MSGITLAVDRGPRLSHPEQEMPLEPDPIIDEALRIYRRYQIEVVEGLGFCPWAKTARLAGRVKISVLPAPEFELEEVLAAVKAAADDLSVEIGLLVFPRLAVDRLEFQRLVRDLGNADDARHERGAVPMAMAAFHPEAAADLSDSARLIPFIRRSPDPTIQLVRISVLERIRGTESSGTAFVDPAMVARGELPDLDERKPLNERVAATNLETVERTGTASIEAILDDIRRDRAASYARVDALKFPSEASVTPPSQSGGDGERADVGESRSSD